MTKENSKRLYEHYVKIGYDKAAADMLEKYPDLTGEKPVVPVVEKSKKTK